MNRIELRVESVCGQPPPESLAAVFGLAGGTIGRSGQNLLILPDPQQQVARIQAMVRLDDGAFHLANLSEQLDVRVDGQVIVSGQETPLTNGSSVEIGNYRLMAVEPGTASDTRRFTNDERLMLTLDPSDHGIRQAVAIPTLPQVFAPDPMAADTPCKADGDPFADIFASLNAPAHDSSDTATREHASRAAGGDSARPAGSPRRALIPEDFDPFLAPSAQSRNHADPLTLLDASQTSLRGIATRAAEESLIDGPPESFASGDVFDPAADPFTATAPVSLLDTNKETDPLKLFDSSLLVAEAKTWQNGIDHVLEINSAIELPAPRVGANAPAVPRAKPPDTSATDQRDASPSADYSAQELAEAFLEGAGLRPHALAVTVNPEFMRLLGGLLFISVKGAIDLLGARSVIKREIRADVTMIMQKGNNPLKFMPSAEGALIQLIGRKIPGFMPAREAIKDTFDDLRAHELGLVAGVRAALLEALTRFEPATIESAARGGNAVSIFSTRRKARHWDSYCANFSRMRSAAEDELKALSGDVFVQAYEAAVEQLRQQR